MTISPGGTFINFGCYDGLTNDPIKDLILDHSLRGYFVDANPYMLGACRQNFGEAHHYVNVGIHTESGIKDFYLAKSNPDDPFWVPQTSTFVKENTEIVCRLIGKPLEAVYDVKRVRTTTISDFIVSRGLRELQVVNMDLEGMDKEVIFDFPFAFVQPSLIIIELISTEHPFPQEAFDHIISQGYTHTGDTTMFSVIFERNI